MFQPTQILVPTDFSRCAWIALEDAAAVAKTYGAALDVLHVWEVPLLPMPGEMAAGLSMPSTVIDAVSQQAHSLMEQLLRDARAKGIAIRKSEVVAGETYRSIVEVAKLGDYDLIVVGTHGRKQLARVVLGSVAERVVRHAPCPVLVARAKWDPPGISVED
jgi:nucleotide-binding universal stress UspA family protein